MINENARLLQPTYFREFHCIGSECEDNCCQQNWVVLVDRKTYKLYRNCRDPVLKPRLDRALKRNRKSENDTDYALLDFAQGGGRCPMLTEDTQCSIHQRLGEKGLCYTCAAYPRVGILAAGLHQVIGTVSCPELARCALLRPEGIQFEEVELPVTGTMARLRFPQSVNPDQPVHPSDPFFAPLRDFTLQMLQHRSLPLWQRIATLALFCSLVDQRLDQEQGASLPALIETFKTMLADGSLMTQLDWLLDTDATSLQRQVLDMLGDEHVYMGLTQRDAFLKLLLDAWTGLGFLLPDGQHSPQATDVDFLLSSFRTAAHRHYQPFLRDREYLLENYLVNLAFNMIFPCRPHDRLFKNLLALVVPYALLRYLLIGVAARHGGLDEAHFIEAVYAFSRGVEHNNGFLKRMQDLLERNGYNTPAGLVALVKDI